MNSRGLKLNIDTLIAGFLIFAFAIGYGIYIYKLNFDLIDPGYRITALMPPLFVICYFVFLHRPIMKYKSPFLIFAIVLTVSYALSAFTIQYA